MSSEQNRKGYHNRSRKPLALLVAASLGAAGVAGCDSTDKTPTASTLSSAAQTPNITPTAARYPWPFCDSAPEHRAQAVGRTTDHFPIVRVDSNCTDPSDPYTGLYKPEGGPRQDTGIRAGRIKNGSLVVALCFDPNGQAISNDRGVSTTRWDLVEPLPNQDMTLPNDETVKTNGTDKFWIPNTHLAFASPPGVDACPSMK